MVGKAAMQNFASAKAPMPRFAVANGTSADRDALRYGGAQERGFAFGKPKRAPITDTIQMQAEPRRVATYSASVATQAASSVTEEPTEELTESPADEAVGTTKDTNAVAVTRDGAFNINVTISGNEGTGGKGVIHFEEGGSYRFSLSDHPGAKYRLVGLDSGNGLSNPNNIKGSIFLNGAEIKLGELKDRAGDFLKRRDEIAAGADEEPRKQKRAGDITLDDLKRFNLLSTPDVGILNIHDDRFDRSKFTDDQVLSLKVAAKLATQETLNPIREDEEEKGRGLKLGQAKDALGSYGRGLKLGHQHAPGILKYFA